MAPTVTDRAYSRAGVDTTAAESAVGALVSVLRTIDSGRTERAALASGHYANVIEIAPNLGIALSTDGVGSKVIVAEQLGKFDTVGIDCIAMNVNDIICIGAEPIAVLDYIAVEKADPDMLRAIGAGLKEGAEQARIEIPGGELAQLPELIRGHPSPFGFDLVGACFGTVALDAMVTGERIEPGDVVLGLPSSGVHSNGLTLARRVLPHLGEAPPELGGETVGEALLTPTVIYVRAVMDLLRSDVDVRGLAHITSGGLINLLRLTETCGFEVDEPLPLLPIFELIAARAETGLAELLEVFNMGCGVCCVVAPGDADRAAELLAAHHPGTRAVGRASDRAGLVELPGLGLAGGADGGFQPA
ncbi:MAG: phosphoribosylformylglycinamidine cyclo-ligase [Thermoleophilaceae bacterium]|nr:phosphoribosylformylglycinamidine cyclo-ligase [Thermoleophilaceae bacterium]